MITIKHLLLTVIFGFSSAASAQQIRVEKVKGDKAVIEMVGTSLTPGKTYSLGSSSGTEMSGGDRHYLVGGSLDWSSYNVSSGGSSSTNTTAMNLLFRFGWNWEKFEVGPVFQYSSASISGSSVSNSNVLVGVFGDYNFIPNRAGTGYVPGVGGEIDFGSRTDSASASLMQVYPSVFLKWFPSVYPFCFRFDLGYLYQKVSYSSGSLTTQGLDVRGGIVEYF